MNIDLDVAEELATRYQGSPDDIGFLADAFLLVWQQWCVRPSPLTKRQHEILSFLSDYQNAHGYAPSFDEIAAQFGMRSLASVHEHLSNITRKGWIRRLYNESRGITILYPPPKVAA
jgi:hypothetical protein